MRPASCRVWVELSWKDVVTLCPPRLPLKLSIFYFPTGGSVTGQNCEDQSFLGTLQPEIRDTRVRA